MSGGHFEDFSNYMLEDIADEIDNIIKHNCSERYVDINGDEVSYNFSPEIIILFKLISLRVREVYNHIHNIDYLLSGDTGEYDFVENTLNVLTYPGEKEEY